MAFGKIFSSFGSSPTVTEKPATEPKVQPSPTFQVIKTPILIDTTSVPQQKKSLRWVKSLTNVRGRTRPAIPEFGLSEPKFEVKVGLDVVKLFQDIDSKFASYFDLAEFEPSDKEWRQKRSIETLRRTYAWQEPGTTNPPYPPCLKSIPRDEQTGLLQIFDATRLIDTTVALLPDELQPKLLADYLYGEPIGKTMAGIQARMKQLTRAKKNIGTEPSVANRDDWYTDAVFGQQSFTGSNPTSIALAGADWVGKFKNVAKEQGRNDVAVLLEYAKTESFYIQDCSYFREAADAAPASILQSDDGKRFGCASVTLYQLREDGTLHPLAIIIDFKISIEQSVVIFNKRITPLDPTITEEQDWPWRYAKMCSQVADWTKHEIKVHLTDCHFVEEATIVAAQRSFTADHIVYRLLEPHWLKTLSLNASARSILVPKVVTAINGFTKAQTYAFILNAYKRFNWTENYIPADLERRGFPTSKLGEKAFHNYAWARNMLPMWNTLYNFVFSVLSTVYKTDDQVLNDKAVQSWCNEMHSPTGGQMTSFPDIETIEDLCNTIVMCIHTASPKHNSVNYLQCYYMSFVPNKPGCLNTPLPTTLDELMAYKEQDVVAALPIHDEQIWLLSSQMPYLLSYGVSEDQTLLNYAQELQDEARGKEGEEWKAIGTAASKFYDELMGLGLLFNQHSKELDDQIVAYNVIDPTELAVSILI